MAGIVVAIATYGHTNVITDQPYTYSTITLASSNCTVEIHLPLAGSL
jgi:hypothetical protein